MFVTLKLLETSLESVPLAILIVAAIVTGGSAGSMLLCAPCPVRARVRVRVRVRV